MDRPSKSAKEDLLERRKDAKAQAQLHGRTSSQLAAGETTSAGGQAPGSSTELLGARQHLAKARDARDPRDTTGQGNVYSRETTPSGKPRDTTGPPGNGSRGTAGSDTSSLAKAETPKTQASPPPAALPGRGAQGSTGQANPVAPSGARPVVDDVSEGCAYEHNGSNDDAGPGEEKAFVEKLKNFHRSRGTEFKVPKFYGVPVNLVKLWRLVCGHGGYDEVTRGKLWRVVGDHFNPPKSCTTLSWSFRGFYEKSLLDYERVHGVETASETAPPSRVHKQKSPEEKRKGGFEGGISGGGSKLSEKPLSSDKVPATRPETKAAIQDEAAEKKGGTEPGRITPEHDAGKNPVVSKKRPPSQRAPADGAASKAEDVEMDLTVDADQELSGLKRVKKIVPEASTRLPLMADSKIGRPRNGAAAGGAGKHAVTQPVTDKSEHPALAKGKQLKKESRKTGNADVPIDTHPVVVWDVGEECSWVKVNIRRSSDCFEIYALVPGLLREEIKIQAEDAGRVVIAGIPEREDNPWGVKKFKKIVVLPAAILAAETKAVVALHGQLYVHLPLAPAAEAKASAQKP